MWSVVLSQAGESGQQAVTAVREIFRRAYRASSLVECINSVLRMHQAQHRKISQEMLDLKRLYWNSHEFRTGHRRGKTPYQLLGVPWPQRDQITTQYRGGVSQFIRDSVEAVLCELPFHDNYFWRVYFQGHYTAQCCPEYVRRENFARLRGLVQRLKIHTCTVTDFLPVLTQPFANVHWAGTETSDYWNGYMDGAVRSGERAAAEVLATL